ncbi:uncharacterized protein L969DRAFT_48727 [Mixia osmundae IAM 14324]|uniref:Uncharacterized protein n=1 Tax=Mixia osmundae (strain CBS 9802 / IAM 14324 / JCM 22182 / KY 12970) TaxID=764103 RepID=G7E424_MIXOS|nr:uncharacterized protein L969DRAFT_48727 [Mixia osmundae IAM 14324]KEI39677.1 hypothetical protein L969DRAFT_48727 [Mixia osmundae IAM 14324]GAA97584.1 hypothetical protein E5Q_04262 [Mixia osmundae IAM 14324]
MRLLCGTLLGLSALTAFAMASPVKSAANSLAERGNDLVERNVLEPHGKDALVELYLQYGKGSQDHFMVIAKLSWNADGYFDQATSTGDVLATFDVSGTIGGQPFSGFTFLSHAADYLLLVNFIHDKNGKIQSCAPVNGYAQWLAPHNIEISPSMHHLCFVNGMQVGP